MVNRVIEQAMLERAPLSDVEKRMLTFPEEDAEPDFAALDAFNEHCNTEQYESRIIQLLRRAYGYDRRHGRAVAWKGTLRALKGQDFYLLSIIDRKGLWRTNLTLPPPSKKDLAWYILCVFAGGGSYLLPFFHEQWPRVLLGACLTIALIALKITANLPKSDA